MQNSNKQINTYIYIYINELGDIDIGGESVQMYACRL